jgi:hypothetical protein
LLDNSSIFDKRRLEKCSSLNLIFYDILRKFVQNKNWERFSVYPNRLIILLLGKRDVAPSYGGDAEQHVLTLDKDSIF